MVRPVTAGGPQGLPGQKCFRSHPVTVVSSDKGAIYVATGQGSGGGGLNPQHRPADQSLRQAAEIVRCKALQAVPVNEELNGLLPACPARHARSRLPSLTDRSPTNPDQGEARTIIRETAAPHGNWRGIGSNTAMSLRTGA
jgi:hypothetical protein